MALAILTSVILESATQKDGRRSVRERHTDQLGIAYGVFYLAEAMDNTATNLATHATNLIETLRLKELNDNVSLATGTNDAPPAPLFNYSTVAQFRAAVRLIFQTATGQQAARLGWYINQLGLTDAQLAAVFGVGNPSAALTTLKAHLVTLSTKYLDVQAQVGE